MMTSTNQEHPQAQPQAQPTQWPNAAGCHQDETGASWYQALMFIVTHDFRVEAVMQAVTESATRAGGGASMRDSRDAPTGLRHITIPQSRVTVRIQDDGWTGVCEADLDENDHDDFWQALLEIVEAQPEFTRVLPLPWERECARPAVPETTREETTREESAREESAREESAREESPKDEHSQGLPLITTETIYKAIEQDPPIAVLESVENTRDPVQYRTWHFRTDQGTISAWDQSNTWMNINEIDLAPPKAREFRRRIREIYDQRDRHLRGDR